MKRYEKCILATCPVPWDGDYNFVEDVFRDQLRHILDKGTRHIYIFGTAGEGYAVGDSQFVRIAKVFAEEMRAHRAEPMVGVISLSLATIIERIQTTYDLGIREFQLSLPAWGACTFDEIRRFFAETCGRFPDCSFLHYNCPRSKRLVAPDEYVLLAEQFPNLVATKNGASTSLDIISLTAKVPQLQHFLTEFDFAIANMLDRDVGLLVSVASSGWKSAKEYYQACLGRRADEINKYVVELKDIHAALVRCVGNQGHMDGAFDKLFSKTADNRFPLRLLPPYGYAGDDSFAVFTRYIKENHPHWID